MKKTIVYSCLLAILFAASPAMAMWNTGKRSGRGKADDATVMEKIPTTTSFEELLNKKPKEEGTEVTAARQTLEKKVESYLLIENDLPSNLKIKSAASWIQYLVNYRQHAEEKIEAANQYDIQKKEYTKTRFGQIKQYNAEVSRTAQGAMSWITSTAQTGSIKNTALDKYSQSLTEKTEAQSKAILEYEQEITALRNGFFAKHNCYPEPLVGIKNLTPKIIVNSLGAGQVLAFIQNKGKK